jgi:endonuclease/exonuclease/phosphatase family metal-dependent hydrolase
VSRCTAILLLVPGLLFSSPERPASVGTWNLQNFLSQNRFEEGAFRVDYPLPEARKKRIRQLILDARPDILFLQEIGSADHLLELQLDLAATGLHYDHAHFSAAPAARSGLAILSRLPIDFLLFHDPIPLDDFEREGACIRRGIQEASFSLNGHRFRFFHLHLKSRYTSDPDDPDSRSHRSAEIKAVIRLLDSLVSNDPSSAFIVAGDFNTPFRDPLMRILRPRWQPLEVADSSGAIWTYQHYSGSRDQIDGFWFPADRPPPLQPLALLPRQDPPSDHRLVTAALKPVE